MKNKNIIKLLILVIILLIISFTAFYITKKRSAEIASNKLRTQIFMILTKTWLSLISGTGTSLKIISPGFVITCCNIIFSSLFVEFTLNL